MCVLNHLRAISCDHEELIPIPTYRTASYLHNHSSHPSEDLRASTTSHDDDGGRTSATEAPAASQRRGTDAEGRAGSRGGTIQCSRRPARQGSTSAALPSLATLGELTLATGQRDAHRLTNDPEDGTETTRLPHQKNDGGSRIGNGCRGSRSRGGRKGIDF